nr:unnamed protein product [Spirometra erinaceieuropaei]
MLCALTTSGYSNDSSLEISPRALADKEVKSGATTRLCAPPCGADKLMWPTGKTSPGTTDMAEGSEDRRRDLRGQPRHRRQSQKRGSKISSASTSQPQPSTTLKLSPMSTDVPAPIELIGHLANCIALTTPSDVPPRPPILCFPRLTPEPPLTSSACASASALTAPAPTTTAVNPNTPTNTNLTTATTTDMDSVHTCPHRDCISTSQIGLAGHLGIPRTETGEPVPGAPI